MPSKLACCKHRRCGSCPGLAVWRRPLALTHTYIPDPVASLFRFGDGEPCGPQAAPCPPPPDLLLLRSLAWWDRRLRTRLREGPTLRRLAWLLAGLQVGGEADSGQVVGRKGQTGGRGHVAWRGVAWRGCWRSCR